MNHILTRRKGIALFLTLTIILIATILANVILTIMLSHSRLSHHQFARIQAYYAAMAGTNFAMERLRLGTWDYPTDCTAATPCVIPADTSLIDPNAITTAVTSLQVVFCPRNSTCSGVTQCNPPTGIDFCINSIATYHTRPTS